MSFLADVANSAVKTITSPFRFVGNAASMGKNALETVGCACTGDLAGAKRNLGELGEATKDAVFSGVETAFLVGGGFAAHAAGEVVAKSVGVHVLGMSAVKEVAKGTGRAYLTAYAETKFNGPPQAR